ncbi:MAG: molybdopterin molybdotransferase MoeA [Synergistales bacterium]|nr:molybdopterin molybdotransferase MoeA [Synergistales bacterium]
MNKSKARTLLPRNEVPAALSAALGFPWEFPYSTTPVEQAIGRIIATDVAASSEIPPFTRSLRDGYAVRSRDVSGASAALPAFLHYNGSVPMGGLPEQKGSAFCAQEIHTGGVLPDGYDAVVMLEDTERTDELIEIRKSIQAGENVIQKGEEIDKGDIVVPRGSRISFTNSGLLSSLGVTKVPCLRPRIGIISTGDEIVPAETDPLPPGTFRDVNAWMLMALFTELGCSVSRYGIAPDDPQRIEALFAKAYEESDVVLVSGGSSVSVRDYTEDLFAHLGHPGLVVQGVNMSPGKPTLLGGNKGERRLVAGLPGHPLSCVAVSLFVVVPVLFSSLGWSGARDYWKVKRGALARDLAGQTGVEEFVPCSYGPSGDVVPEPSKSGYIGVLQRCGGFIRLAENEETKRQGEMVEVFEW